MTDQPSQTRRICVLMNAGSGKRDTARTRDLIARGFDAAGRTAEIREIAKGRHIPRETRRALKDGFDIIVAAGGDGTIAGIAGEIRGSGTLMGIIPLGTFNYFARSLDIPEDAEEAARLVADGTPRPVRIGAINGRTFLNNASLGAYPAILRTREETYRRWGRSRMAAYWSVLVTLVTLRRPLRLRIDADGKASTHRTPLAFAVNNAFQLRQIGLEGEEHIAAGRLALFVAPDTGRWGMLKNALALAMGRAQRDVQFHLIGAERITIAAKRSLRDVACDGERAKMRAPFTLEAREGELTVIAPAARRDDLR
ncbi:diacylglycerol/lipid kinase family protein [Roseovarius aquimarinus]|uniref:Diacylglycerol/lipid kinase family protein n=1 Tax=Roseovarius aquimarinus TaxID=1229156 RepID=A0ABW7IB61_9RHOB